MVHRTKPARAYASVPKIALHSVANSNEKFPEFPHNERSKNERPPLLHFAFFLLHFAFNQQVKKQREAAT